MTDKNLGITEVVLRDGHQSLLATRFRYEDMEEILVEHIQNNRPVKKLVITYK